MLHRGNGAEPETLDMHKSTGVPEANIQRDLFEGLVSVAADGSLIPGAAKSWEQDESGKIWTFTLRDDGKWSNGETVVASDFVNAFQRALSPETASEYAFILWPVKNAKAINKGEIKDVSKSLEGSKLERKCSKNIYSPRILLGISSNIKLISARVFAGINSLSGKTTYIGKPPIG